MTKRIFFAVCLVFGLSMPTAKGQIPDTFSNLKLHDPDISKGELIGTMRGFAVGLGVRCLHCHVGTDGDKFTDVVFESDDKETKRIARVMIEMTREINATIRSKTGRDPAILTTVTCYTCHHAKNKPADLRIDLRSAYESGGAEAVLSLYGELREQYYGRATYDFAHQVLTNLAIGFHNDGDTDGAIALLKANMDYFPKAHYTWYITSQVYHEAGDRKAAIKAARKAIKIDPENAFYKKNLTAIRTG